MTQPQGPMEPAPRTLADRINWLFAMVKPEGEDREFRGREVVAGVQAQGTELSASHLSELRRGVKANPTLRVLQGLADFFGVKVAYFFDDEVRDQVEAELRLKAAMRDSQVRDVAFRVAGLAPHQRDAMYRLLADTLAEFSDEAQPGTPPEAPGRGSGTSSTEP